MKTSVQRDQRATILFNTLIIALLVGIVVGALLIVAQQQNYLAARSQTWASEIPIAEAGIEEAMAHLNTRPTNFATHGWTLVARNYTKKGTFPEGYYYTAISTSLPPTIVSIGYGRIPLQTNYTHRTIMTTTKLTRPAWGIVAKQSISMNGSVTVDSFDSSDSQYSTGSRYDATKARDKAGVGTLSSAIPAIDTGGAEIYGSVATGPSGTAVGTVGDGTWCSTSSGIQPGHATDDFNLAIVDITAPAGIAGKLPPMSGTIGGVPYNHVLSGGDYAMLTGCSMSGSGGDNMIVTGKARLYIRGELKLVGSGTITIAPGVSLEIYLDGNASLGGGGIANGTQVAEYCALYGLPACTDLKYSGNAQLNARIYAPEARLNITGTVDFSGSIVADSIRFVGTPAIHYDEALSGSGPDYRIVSWEEM
jgi:hypothetical protein